MRDTKDPKNKTNILWFIVENIAKNFKDVLEFDTEITHVDMAARIDVDFVRKTLNEIDTGINLVESELLECNKMSREENNRYLNIIKH